MANMGTTGTINITKDMITAALKAVEDYQTEITNLNTQLQSEIDSLIPTSFSGSAAEGFKFFYDNSIAPNTGINLTKMLSALTDICNAVMAQIPGEEQGVDEQLAQGNKNPGGQA